MYLKLTRPAVLQNSNDRLSNYACGYCISGMTFLFPIFWDISKRDIDSVIIDINQIDRESESESERNKEIILNIYLETTVNLKIATA